MPASRMTNLPSFAQNVTMESLATRVQNILLMPSLFLSDYGCVSHLKVQEHDRDQEIA